MDRKWTYLLFAAGAVALGYLLLKAGDWAWGYYGAKPNDLLVSSAAFGAAGVAALVAVRNQRIYALASEVTTELSKVTWPTRRETMSATVVVIITVIIAAAFLGLCDGFWSFLSSKITP